MLRGINRAESLSRTVNLNDSCDIPAVSLIEAVVFFTSEQGDYRRRAKI